MRTTILLASFLSLAIGAPALAQDAMSSGDAMAAHSMKMSPAMQHKVAMCNAMSHDAMMKNASCAKLMKAHPDLMNHAMGQDSMMSAPH